MQDEIATAGSRLTGRLVFPDSPDYESARLGGPDSSLDSPSSSFVRTSRMSLMLSVGAESTMSPFAPEAAGMPWKVGPPWMVGWSST